MRHDLRVVHRAGIRARFCSVAEMSVAPAPKETGDVPGHAHLPPRR